MAEEFRFSFGVKYGIELHPVLPTRFADPDGYITVIANSEFDARLWFIQNFTNAFCATYTPDQMAPVVHLWPSGELFRFDARRATQLFDVGVDPYGGKLANARQQAYRRSRVQGGPCEVCGESHATVHCCDQCAGDQHVCSTCREPLGHSLIDSCPAT